MSREEVKFTKMSRWNVHGEIKTFEEGDTFMASPEMAAEMVTHNYAEYTDPTKAVKVEENKAVESTEDVKEADVDLSLEDNAAATAEEPAEDPQTEEQADQGDVGQGAEPEDGEEVKLEEKKSKKKKKGKKSSKR